MFGAAAAGGVYVPVNPLLKAEQVGYILQDCNVRVLLTSNERLTALRDSLAHCRSENSGGNRSESGYRTDPGCPVARLANCWPPAASHIAGIDGVTRRQSLYLRQHGKTKGVVLSHRNIVAGAGIGGRIPANRRQHRLAGGGPLSFDYGMNQLTSAFLKRAPARCC